MQESLAIVYLNILILQFLNDVVLKSVNYYDSYNRIEYYYRDDYYYKVDFDLFECRDNEKTYTLLIEESSGKKMEIIFLLNFII